MVKISGYTLRWLAWPKNLLLSVKTLKDNAKILRVRDDDILVAL